MMYIVAACVLTVALLTGMAWVLFDGDWKAIGMWWGTVATVALILFLFVHGTNQMAQAGPGPRWWVEEVER